MAVVLATLSTLFAALPADRAGAELAQLQGQLAGEVTDRSVILQSRLTADALDIDGDVRGQLGVARFEVARTARFAKTIRTPWKEAGADNDYTVQVFVDGLSPMTEYYYRLEFGETRQATQVGPSGRFRTLAGAKKSRTVDFVAMSGMNRQGFLDGSRFLFFWRVAAAREPDRTAGFPGLAAIADLKPDFVIGTGDNVYYDADPSDPARDRAAMRRVWHQTFTFPRARALFGSTATYWIKDDRDFRFDQADNEPGTSPDRELGIDVFREQLPVVAPDPADGVTYRTHRVSRELQLWFLEGRDYRSPNGDADGEEKTLWGTAQREWLYETLLASDAAFKVVVTPTPIVGPGRRLNDDNHTSTRGFRGEGQAFLRFARDNELAGRLFIVTGDRHWQYHSIDPSGIEEFSTGNLTAQDAVRPVRPGSWLSTDPGDRIEQPYASPELSGGFLRVRVRPATSEDPLAEIGFAFFADDGKLLYEVGHSSEMP